MKKESLTKREGEKVFPEIETELTSFGLMSGFAFEPSASALKFGTDIRAGLTLTNCKTRESRLIGGDGR